MSAKKHKLSVSIDEDYCLLGVVSDEPDYKVCWLLNQQMNFSLARTADLKLFNKRLNIEQEVTLFKYYDDNALISYRLIGNKTSSGYFLPELKNIDYLLHIQGVIDLEEITKLIKMIGSIKSVRMCVPVDLSKIKERERLQLW